MLLRLSEKDCGVIRELRSEGVFEDMDSHKLVPDHKVVVVTCADGHQFQDLATHLFQKMTPGESCIHVFSWNGGPLRLIEKSPANKRGRSTAKDFLEEIRDARETKNINTVALYIHFPCAKALVSGIEFLQSIQILFAAKKVLKQRLRNIKVACFCHVDYGTAKRTYFTSSTKFARWYSQNHQKFGIL